MKIRYSLILELPAVTASLGVIGKDVDIVVKRNHKGEPYFTGKHIKGILRDRVAQFKCGLGQSKEETEEFISRYFGKEGNAPLDKKSYKLRFSNLYMKPGKECNVYTRHGIRVDRRTRSTEAGSLFDYEFIEKGTEFEGTITVPDDMEREDLKFILASLYHLDYIGGMKSRGLGKVTTRIENRDISKLENLVSELLSGKRKKEKKYNKLTYKRYSYVLKLEEPVILKEKEIGNYISVRTTIQGSTVRGALIHLLRHKYGIELEKLLPVEASAAYYGRTKLASEFKTKYKVNGVIKRRDRVVYKGFEVNGVKLERDGEEKAEYIGNEVSIGIDNRLGSVENEKLFNSEYIEESRELKGDAWLPEEIVKDNETMGIYLGKSKSKGYGKARITFSSYKETGEKLSSRIKNLNAFIKKNKSGEKGRVYITFDLQSDLLLPFVQIYDVAEQFKALNRLGGNYTFESGKSFINTGKLEGYNIINRIRKMDEVVVKRGSVITYSLPCEDLEKEMEFLERMEKKSCGLRTAEGFGRVSICSSREFPKEKKSDEKKKEKDEFSARKQELFRNVIERHFKSSLEKLKPAQMNRFHAMVRNRKYYMDSNMIKAFVEKQIERGEKKINDDLIAAGEFYKAFMDNILDKIELDSKEGMAIMSFIKKYTRYAIGKRKIEELLKDKKGEQ